MRINEELMEIWLNEVCNIDYYNAFSYEVSEDVIHHGLEGGWAVGHPRKHY